MRLVRVFSVKKIRIYLEGMGINAVHTLDTLARSCALIADAKSSHPNTSKPSMRRIVFYASRALKSARSTAVLGGQTESISQPIGAGENPFQGWQPALKSTKAKAPTLT